MRKERKKLRKNGEIGRKIGKRIMRGVKGTVK